MRSTTSRRLICSVVFLAAMSWANHAHAQFAVGSTWVRTDAMGKGITLTLEACCNGGLRLVYRIPAMGDQPAVTMTVDSPMDGTEVPSVIGGKPTGQTMAAKRVDDRHYTAAMKMGAGISGTSTGVVSPDGKSMTVETVSQVGGKTQKVIETWVRK